METLTWSSDPAANKLHWSCSPAANAVPDRCSGIKLEPMAPSKFGCNESAVLLTTEPQWDCREAASVLLTDRPPCCGQALAELSCMSLGIHRCCRAISRNDGNQGQKGSKSLFLLIMTCFLRV